MCLLDDAEPWEFVEIDEHRARKPHRCCECRRIIKPGELYERVAGKCDGSFDVFKICQHCQGARKWLDKECGGSIYGAVYEDLRDHLDYGGIKLARLVVGMKRSWRSFNSDALMPVPTV